MELKAQNTLRLVAPAGYWLNRKDFPLVFAEVFVLGKCHRVFANPQNISFFVIQRHHRPGSTTGCVWLAQKTRLILDYL